MIADRVPVLLPLVPAEALGTRIHRDRIEVGEIPALVPIEVEAIEEPDGCLDVAEDARIAGDPIGLRRTGERVDLLVHRNRVVIVAELRREDLLLLGALDVDPVVPVDDVLVGVHEAHVVAQVFRAQLRRIRGSLSSPVIR